MIKLTNLENEVYLQMKARMEAYKNEIVQIRTSTYKGKGRPRKADFIRIPRSQVRDYRCFESFQNAFTTTYVK